MMRISEGSVGKLKVDKGEKENGQKGEKAGFSSWTLFWEGPLGVEMRGNLLMGSWG